jgi:hypothetical protein
MPLRKCFTFFLTVLAVGASAASAAAQQPPRLDQKSQLDQKIDQQKLLAQTRRAYYQPMDRGVRGFACTVAFDWDGILERASGRKIPSREPTLVKLKSASVIVTDDLIKGVTIKADFPTGAPAPGSPAASREKILENLVTASLDGWNPFLSDRVFPMEGTRYRFEAVPTGYRLTLEGGTFFSILDLDPQLRVTHGESHLNGTTTDFTPTFDPSSHGWLITSLKTSTTQSVTGSAEAKADPAPPSGPADNDKASFTFSYQFVEDMLVPKRVIVQYADGLETPYDLKDCVLKKSVESTAESKAAPAAQP